MEAHVTIRGPCPAVIRRRRKLVPNQRYNININSNSNSNSYLLLLSMDSDVYLGSLSANALVTSSVFDTNFSYLPRVHGVFVVIPVIIFVFDITLFY